LRVSRTTKEYQLKFSVPNKRPLYEFIDPCHWIRLRIVFQISRSLTPGMLNQQPDRLQSSSSMIRGIDERLLAET